MGLLDFLFGDSEDENVNKKKQSEWSTFGNDYDDYYSTTFDSAMEGDPLARAEMEDEFGDDWESFY